MASIQVERVYSYVCAGVCKELSAHYGFSYIEAMALLEASEVVKAPGKKTTKKEKVVISKPQIALPFLGVIDGLCCAVVQDGGLYTQCKKVAKEGRYCTRCSKQASSESGLKFGDVFQRVEMGEEWCTPDGKKPKQYGNVMLKKNISREDAVYEAEKFGWDFPLFHFEVETKPKKAPAAKRGRPQKKKNVEVLAEADDLISELITQAQLENESVQDEEMVVVAKKPKKAVAKKTAEEREAEKLAKQQAKEAEKLEKQKAREAEKLAKQQAKEAEKLAKQKAKEAEKLAKQKAKEAEKKTKKMAAKEPEPEVEEPEQEVEEPEQEVEEPELEVEEPEQEVEEPELEEEEEEEEEENEEEEEEVQVVKFVHNGVTYLRDGDNVLYDMESQEVVGTWDDIIGKITPLADDEEDEE